MVNKLNKIILLLVIAITIKSCKSDIQHKKIDEEKSNPSLVVLTEQQYKNSNIESVASFNGVWKRTLKLQGETDVHPEDRISVNLPLGGYLKFLDLIPGKYVSKGQKLAEVEDPSFIQLQQDFLMAAEKLKTMELDYSRQKELNDKGAKSDKSFQFTTSDLNTQRIIFNSLSEKLKLIGLNPTRIQNGQINASIAVYAPESGYITKVNGNRGSYITPESALCEIINLDNLHIRMPVFESDLSALKLNQTIQVWFLDNPEKKFNAAINLIGKEINIDGTTEVHAHFLNPDKNVLPGMYVNAEVETEQTFKDLIPEESVVEYGGENFIFVELKERTFKRIPVKVLDTGNGFVKLNEKLIPANTKLITKGAYTLLMQMENKED